MVSIIIPVYQVEKYICRCLDSIMSQSYHDIEILTIDDGGSDTSAECCDEYARLLPNCISIHKKNTGVSDTRNTGIKLSSGNYVSFVDSDDWIDKDCIKTLMGELIKNSTDMAVCEAIIAYGENNVSNSNVEVSSVNRTGREAIEYYVKLDSQYASSSFRSPWGKIIRKEVALKHLFPVGRGYAEDSACVYLWMWDSSSISCITKQLYFYFQNPNSVCHSMSIDHYLDSLETEREWICFFQNNSFEELLSIVVDNYIMNTYWIYKRIKPLSDNNAHLFKELMKKALKEYKMVTTLTLRNDSDLYLVDFPKLNNVYKHLLATEKMMKEHGLGAVIKRLLRGR